MANEKQYDLKDMMKVMVGNDSKPFDDFLGNYGLNCVEKRDKRNLLMYSILQKKDEYSKKLIELGINVNHQDKTGFSALHYAVQENNLEIVLMLLKNKVTVDLLDSNGNSPLWRAAYNKKKTDEKIITALIKAGADIHKKNNHGIAPDKFLDEKL